jgi:hypothetical protein
MQEFSALLLNASKTLGTLLDVANLLEVEPKLVYGWLAGFEQPAAARIEGLTERLLEGLAPRPAFAHPRRRAADARLAA